MKFNIDESKIVKIVMEAGIDSYVLLNLKEGEVESMEIIPKDKDIFNTPAKLQKDLINKTESKTLANKLKEVKKQVNDSIDDAIFQQSVEVNQDALKEVKEIMERADKVTIPKSKETEFMKKLNNEFTDETEHDNQWENATNDKTSANDNDWVTTKTENVGGIRLNYQKFVGNHSIPQETTLVHGSESVFKKQWKNNRTWKWRIMMHTFASLD